MKYKTEINDLINDVLMNISKTDVLPLKDKIMYCDYIIKKQNSVYNIYYHGKKLDYEVTLLESAAAIVDCLLVNNTGCIKIILEQDWNYFKNQSDMQMFKNGYCREKAKNTDNCYIFEHRYAIAKQRALAAIREIQHWRGVLFSMKSDKYTKEKVKL